MKRPVVFALIVVMVLFVAGCTSPAAPTPTPAPSVNATPTPMATAPQNITVTLPPGSPTAIVTITHYIHGTILYNKQPTSNYHVLVATDKGNEYGNVTDASGRFNVTFPDDGSATYKIRLADSANNLVYEDSLPRYLNATGPMNVSIEIPWNVSISQG